MPNHNKEFTRDDCIWIHERDDMIGKLERIEAATVQIPMLVEGVKRINGSIADHEARLRLKTEQIAVLQDHDKAFIKLKWAIYGLILMVAGSLIVAFAQGKL